MKQAGLLLLLLCSFDASAQLELSQDTVFYTQKTGGAIDTFDISGDSKSSTFDAGVALSGKSGFSVTRLYNDITNYRLHQQTDLDPLRYASLPHLGFAYSFGSQGAQMLHLQYTQVFRPNFILNLNYDRKTGAGFLRNSNFSGDNVRLKIQRTGQRYSTRISGSFQSYETFHPDGITTDTLIQDLGLDFTAVNRNGSSSTKIAQIAWENYLNFTGDSLNHLGLVVKQRFAITHREYFETSATNLSGYNQINYDSLTTQDSWNQPAVENGAGVYFLNKTTNFYLDGTVSHRYWNSWDVRDLRDTNEIQLQSELRFKWKGVQLRNSFHLNLVGGFNGFENKASARYDHRKIKIAGHATFTSMPADPLQRFYYGNNYDYSLATINRQVHFILGGNVKYTVKDSLLSIEGDAKHFSLPSVYTFTGSAWELNDSLGSASSVGIKAHLQLKSFNILQEVIFSTDRNNYIPSAQIYSRLYFKGKLFEAKRLEAVIGVDVSYQTGHSLRTYIPSLDTYSWSSTGTDVNPGMLNLDFFASMGIAQFRFFARFENIGYFWNDRTVLEANGYPIASTRIRVGITWDFFN